MESCKNLPNILVVTVFCGNDLNSKESFFCNILQIQLIPKFISSPSLFTICSYMSFRCGFLRREAFDGFAEELDHILVITNRPEKKIWYPICDWSRQPRQNQKKKNTTGEWVSYNTCWLLQQHSNTVSRYIFFSMECFGLVSIHCRRCMWAKANTARRLAILSLVLEQSWQGPAFQTTDDVGNTNLVSSRIFTNWQALLAGPTHIRAWWPRNRQIQKHFQRVTLKTVSWKGFPFQDEGHRPLFVEACLYIEWIFEHSKSISGFKLPFAVLAKALEDQKQNTNCWPNLRKQTNNF